MPRIPFLLLNRAGHPAAAGKAIRIFVSLFGMLAAACLLAALVPGDVAAKPPGGKGGGGGGGGSDDPPLVLPNVEYEVAFIEDTVDSVAAGEDVNDSGVVVGLSRDTNDWSSYAIVVVPDGNGDYDSDGDSIVDAGLIADLNSFGYEWTDLDSPEGNRVAGWTATRARGINNVGEITGEAWDVNGNGRAFVLSNGLFQLLPNAGGAWNGGMDINDFGAVVANVDYGNNLDDVAVYSPIAGYPYYQVEVLGAPSGNLAEINDLGEVVTWFGTHRTLDDSGYKVNVYPDYNSTSINNIGDIVGGRQKVGKGKNATPAGAFLLPSGDPIGSEILYEEGRVSGAKLNDFGDVVYSIEPSNGFPLATLATPGFDPVRIDDLLAPSGPSSLQGAQYPYAISNPDNTGFGTICGFSSISGGFILKPRMPAN